MWTGEEPSSRRHSVSIGAFADAKVATSAWDGSCTPVTVCAKSNHQRIGSSGSLPRPYSVNIRSYKAVRYVRGSERHTECYAMVRTIFWEL